MYNEPSVSDFKSFFCRDFPFGSTTDKVMNSDIQRAFDEAKQLINPDLFSSQEQYTLAYEYLSAHLLVTNLRASSQGIAGSYSWLTSSKSVGSVSEGLSIPDYILSQPTLAIYAKTNYGVKYLLMVLPKIVGNTFMVCGRTTP